MEELRTKHKSLQNAAHHIALDCINPQSTHGSPYHVHPYPSPVRLQHAFSQHSPKMFHPKGLKPHLALSSLGFVEFTGVKELRSVHKAKEVCKSRENWYSGLDMDPRAYTTPNESPILGRALCLTPKGSPVPGRVSHLNEKFQDSLTLTSDTDALVAKISAMFPTVSETHIKILLKKYYNREAVVISALQVEKHPITTPGPLTMSPSAVRLQKGAVGVYSALQLAKGAYGSTQGSSHLTPLSMTPYGSPSLLRPGSGASSYYGVRSVDGQSRHQSPKMKLKYLKSIFPKAEETLILDVLANKDNNVQKASEELITMGFSKKETIVKKEKETPQQPKKVVIIMKTLEEKNALKQKLQKQYSSVAERVISIALDSVDYHEERAEQILNAMLLEEEMPKLVKAAEVKELRSSIVEQMRGVCDVEVRAPSPPPVAPATRRLKTWTEQLKPILKSTSSSDSKYKSKYSTTTRGPDPSLRHGPKDSLLLEDYVPWSGPDPELRTGQSVKPEGPEPRGRLFSLAKGPSGLAKGPASHSKSSLYQKIHKKSAKIIG